jgi:RimJ/RimL family protein N-acetyltransferase
MKLLGINVDGTLVEAAGSLPEVAQAAVDSTVQLYSKVGWSYPWIGYLAFENQDCVGTCAFTSAPKDGIVEIAYFTFPNNEGRGVATRMAEALVAIARKSTPGVSVTAHTLPAESASTRILRKLGFDLVGPRTHPDDGVIWVWLLKGRRHAPEPPLT